LRDDPDQSTAGSVTVAVVNALESVNINHDDGKWLCVTCHPCDFFFQHQVKGAHVQQAGQVICLGQPGDAFLGL